ncbi:hypothetical protein KXD40_007134 [Peronospora effusa]|uniref:Uncharacterized protein n=1 Tax=Peronospora effusa TaxID=542832 RepID=A0A3M6V7Q8_9STRA|nr:hypothetical protein DD238_007657 [Peronospora effusa]RQM15578.1 hypothetical protein DD237_007349 [Peronospora effusa]UIZ24680.1 hypothetical protein KXD40_007134 [Peronospora effusa]CAI5700720.1 unnamed protein product [Peronospora effusa]
MVDSDDSTTRSLLQHIIFVLLLVIGLTPFLLILWNKTANSGRLRGSLCYKHCFGSCARRVYYDEADLRTLRELEQPIQRESVGISGAYRLYQARKSRLTLHLASWREDVKRGSGDDGCLHHKLAQILAAQNQYQQSQQAAAEATTGMVPANQVILTSTVPINGRENESSSSSVASNWSDMSDDSDNGSAYELVPPTPKTKSRAPPGRRYGVIIEGEDEVKEDATLCAHDIV